MNDASQLTQHATEHETQPATQSCELSCKHSHKLKLLFLPYMGLGGFIGAGAGSERGYTSGLVWTIVVGAVLLGALWARAMMITRDGRRYFGMDRPLWIAGVILAMLVGCGIVYFTAR